MLEIVRHDDAEQAPSFRIARTFDDPRLELVRLLHEACEVEHSLMLQYLYAAYSVRPRYAALVGEYAPSSRTLLGVAVEEMLHLRDVNSLLVQLGAAPNLARQGFPYEAGIYPFEMSLEPLSQASIAKYVYAEAPRGVFDGGRSGDPSEQRFTAALLAHLPEQRLNHVGSLYGTILSLLVELDAGRGSGDVARWTATVARIKEEGETGHYQFFCSLFLGTHEGFAGQRNPWDDPSAPTYPSGPVAVAASAGDGRDGAAVPLARLGNHAYWTALLLLDAGYRSGQRDGLVLRRLASVLMTDAIHPIGRALAARSLGLPFEPLSIGFAPGLDLRRSLELAAELLRVGADLAAEVPPQLGFDHPGIAVLLRTTRERVKYAIRGAAPEVVIAGTGPAGLAAAAALVRQGVAVRLLESAPIVGGKVQSERTADGRSVEHGVHGWWPNYRNFDRLLEWAGVALDDALRIARGGALVTRPRALAALRDPPVTLPSPLFVGALLARGWIGPPPRFLRARDLLSAIRFGVHALAFEHERDYERYDALSFKELITRLGASPALEKFILRPFAMCFDYAPPERVSAASVLSALQFYLLPSQQSIHPRWSCGLPQETVFAPLTKAIADHGAIVDRRTILESVQIEDGAVSAAWVIEAGAQPQGGGSEVLAKVPLSSVANGRFEEVPGEGGTVLVGNVAGGPKAFSGICPHAAGPVEWAGGKFVCHRHGSTFDATGRVLSGPARDPLLGFQVRQNGSSLEVLGSQSRRLIPCSHVIVATDVPRAQQILRRSPGVPPTLVERVGRLRTTPIVVVRLWFRTGTTVPDIESIVLPEPLFADVYFGLNAIHRSHDAEGVVVELHCCVAEDKWIKATDEEILEAAFYDLATITGSLTRDRLRSPNAYVIQRHESVFTRYAPGDARNRPRAATPVAGLHLAGDWTAADWSVWMMERAVVSGLRAANRVLASRGLPACEIERLGPEGALLTVSRWVARGVRRLLPDDVPPRRPHEEPVARAPADPSNGPLAERHSAALDATSAAVAERRLEHTDGHAD